MRNDPLVMSREEMLQRLSLFARGGEVAPADGGLTPAMPRDQLKAMEQLAKLVGWDKPKDDAGDTDLKRLADILEGRNAKETDS